MKIDLPRNAAIAGAIALLTAVGGMSFVLGSSRGGAASAEEGPAAIGEAREASLTVAVPNAVNDKIYGAETAAGRPIVVIDAGHGGRDPGARSVSGEVVEKDLTLALAKDLRDQLVERGRVRVALTRGDDSYLTLEDRAEVARRLGAAMFVSLHMDSAPNPLARGASVYSLSDVASDAEAERLAASENKALDRSAGSDGSVRAILSDLVLRSQMTASANLAERLVHSSTGRVGLRPQPHRFADFHVLRSAGVPAVLFEAGYISNVDDEALLRDPAKRAQIVAALARTIEADIAARSVR